uniref:Ig-like domain-containing protein n=1 Tax=Macrostomum lignano TaxID=282301 RepID=A0A1I8HAW4_9PLAT
HRSPLLQAMPLLLLLLLLLLPNASLGQRARQRHKQRWRRLPAKQLPSSECGHEFHDAQSKWLQSDLVLRATWRASDESTPIENGAYNISMTVGSQLKPWRQNLEGRRITVGTFNRTQVRQQRARQRQTCMPCDLRRRPAGYVFFLTATRDPGFFRLAFLPARFKKKLKKKFNRVQCNEMRACPRPPQLVKEMRKRIRRISRRGGGRRGMRLRLRLVCRANGLPRPRPLWLRDGEPVKLGRGRVAQFKTRKGIVTSRLVLRRASPDDAGNYTCVFRNLQGSISSSIVLAAPQPQNYLCNYKNVTYCLNGGTCVISRITNKPSCQCPEEYMGFFCENINIEYMYREQIRQSLIRNLAVAGVSETTLSATTLVAGLALIALFVVLLAICCMVADIRRRLDRKHWTVPAGKRSSDEEELGSRLTSSIRSPAPHFDASTMTEFPVHPVPLCLSTNPREPSLSNGPTNVAVPTAAAEPRRSHNSGAAGGGAPLSYTYRTPGPSSSQPVEFHIQP